MWVQPAPNVPLDRWAYRRGVDRSWQVLRWGIGRPGASLITAFDHVWQRFADRLFADGTTLASGDSDCAAAVEDLPAFLAKHYGAWRSGLAGLEPVQNDEPGLEREVDSKGFVDLFHEVCW